MSTKLTPKILKKEPLDTKQAKWVTLHRLTYQDQTGKTRVRNGGDKCL